MKSLGWITTSIKGTGILLLSLCMLEYKVKNNPSHPSKMQTPCLENEKQGEKIASGGKACCS